MHVQEKSHVNMRPLFLMPASSACPFLASERSRRPPQASSPRVSSPFSPCCPWLLPPRRPPRHGHPPGPPCGTLSTLSTRTARPAGAVDEPGTVFTPILLSPPSLAPTFRSPSSMRHLEFPAALQDNCQFEGPDRERERKRERELH